MISCKKYTLCVVLFGFFLFFFVEKVCAQTFYLKAEAPIVNTSLKSALKSESSSFSGNVSSSYSIPSFGVGYNLSDYLEAELVYGLQNYSLFSYGFNETFKIPSGVYTVASRAKYAGAGATRSILKESSCADLETVFIEGESLCRLCGDGAHASSTISSLSTSGKLHSLVASARIKPFKQLSIFTPYVSLGAGIAHSNSKYTYFSYASGSSTKVSKGSKSTTGLALELGVGTKINLARKVDIDISAKYFDYGKHAMAPNISKKISGYKVSAGMILGFPIGNNDKAIRRERDYSDYTSGGRVKKESIVQEKYTKLREVFVRKEALAAGERRAAITIARRMLEKGMIDGDILNITKLSALDLSKIKNKK